MGLKGRFGELDCSAINWGQGAVLLDLLDYLSFADTVELNKNKYVYNVMFTTQYVIHITTLLWVLHIIIKQTGFVQSYSNKAITN